MTISIENDNKGNILVSELTDHGAMPVAVFEPMTGPSYLLDFLTNSQWLSYRRFGVRRFELKSKQVDQLGQAQKEHLDEHEIDIKDLAPIFS